MGNELIVSTWEQDLGSMMDVPMKTFSQCSVTEKEIKQILAIIRKATISKTEKSTLSLYKSLIQLHLEYCLGF